MAKNTAGNAATKAQPGGIGHHQAPGAPAVIEQLATDKWVERAGRLATAAEFAGDHQFAALAHGFAIRLNELRLHVQQIDLVVGERLKSLVDEVMAVL